MSFNQLLSSFDLEIAENMRECATSDSIQAAIQTGFNADLDARQSILRELSESLACNAEDLNFLYEAALQEVGAQDEEDLTLKVPCMKTLLGLAANEDTHAPYRIIDLVSINEAAE